MDLKNYTSFFHDGSLTAIHQSGNKITLSMESAEMDEEDMKDDLVLSKDHRIRGRLHIDGVQSIKVDGQPYTGILKIQHEEGDIHHFEINPLKIELQISWISFSQKVPDNFSIIEIEAENFWWENTPEERK